MLGGVYIHSLYSIVIYNETQDMIDSNLKYFGSVGLSNIDKKTLSLVHQGFSKRIVIPTPCASSSEKRQQNQTYVFIHRFVCVQGVVGSFKKTTVMFVNKKGQCMKATEQRLHVQLHF